MHPVASYYDRIKYHTYGEGESSMRQMYSVIEQITISVRTPVKVRRHGGGGGSCCFLRAYTY